MKFGPILENKVLQKCGKQKVLMIKVVFSNLIFFNEKDWKDSADLTLKPKNCKFQCQISNRTLIYQRPFKLSTIYYSIKLPFDAKVAEKFLHGLEYLGTG